VNGADQQPLVGEIEQFLTGSRHVPEPDRVLATILLTDIVGSTKQAASIGDRQWQLLLDSHDRVVREQLSKVSWERDQHNRRRLHSFFRRTGPSHSLCSGDHHCCRFPRDQTAHRAAHRRVRGTWRRYWRTGGPYRRTGDTPRPSGRRIGLGHREGPPLLARVSSSMSEAKTN
jgi:class 3 adenylate cyclase